MARRSSGLGWSMSDSGPKPIVVDVEVEPTVVGVDVEGVAVGGALEHAAATTASPMTMMCLAFIDPPRPLTTPTAGRRPSARSLSRSACSPVIVHLCNMSCQGRMSQVRRRSEDMPADLKERP